MFLIVHWIDMLETMRNGPPSKGETSKTIKSSKKATSKTINCENETSEDETNESDIESMESSLMVRKFDFILYNIWEKRNTLVLGLIYQEAKSHYIKRFKTKSPLKCALSVKAIWNYNTFFLFLCKYTKM